MSRKQKYTNKVNISYSPETNEVQVKFLPHVENPDVAVTVAQLNTMLAGISVGLTTLMARLPILRPATKEEVDAKIYIFADAARDSALFEQRKNLFYALEDTFSSILTTSFPDVVYVENCRKFNQEQMLDATPEAAEARRLEVERLAKSVRKEETTNGTETKETNDH